MTIISGTICFKIWDNAGNLVSQSNNGIIVASYTYDCHNRMLTASVNTSSGTIEQSALVYIITHPKMFSALILLTVMLWVGLVLKVSSNSDEVENEDVGAAMETTGDVLLDSAYVFISEFLGLPPNTIPFCVDLVIILVKFLRENH